MKFYLSSNPDSLKLSLSQYTKTATVEAEYGDVVVEGSVLTLAHHGVRSSNPAPCLAENMNIEIEAIGLSHIDLDSIGGCAAILGIKPICEDFWKLAAYIDVNGPHKILQSGASDKNIRMVYAYWAWSKNNKTFAPFNGSACNVSEAIMKEIKIIERIIGGDEELLEAGDKFKDYEEKLNKSSFIEERNGVIVRVSDEFTNHLYVTPSGKICIAVCAFRTDFHSCIVSLADKMDVNCCEIVREVWPDKDENGKFLAGGHSTIAGSPRGKILGLKDLLKLFNTTVDILFFHCLRKRVH